MLVEELYRMAGYYKTCIIVVLHLAPSVYKLRSHLGSEIQRKATGILCIEKNESTGNSVLKAIKVREGNPMNVPNLQFAWDEAYGYHVLVESYPTAKNEKISYVDLVNELFDHKNVLSYADICDFLQKKLQFQ